MVFVSMVVKSSCHYLQRASNVTRFQVSMLATSSLKMVRCLSTTASSSNSINNVSNSNGKAAQPGNNSNKIDCSQPTGLDDDDLEELEDMFVQGPAGMEWNGPTRGGRRPEPTRYGDWERKGRASDF